MKHDLEKLGVKIEIYQRPDPDNAIVVCIDTDFEPNGSDGGPGLRVLINDDDTYSGVPYQPAAEYEEA